MSEPKACPFCGKEDWYFEQGEEGDTNIACDWCGYKSRIFRTIGDAYRWWQTRPIEDDLRKRIAELEAENERIDYFFKKLRMYCIFAHWDNPNTEDGFNEVDAEIREYLSEYKENVK